MYKFYNNNALGLFEDDCSVRSIATATGRTWDETYQHLSNLARQQGKMMDDREFIIGYLDTNYDRVDYLPYRVGNVAYEYPNNVLLITMNGHITCSKYGVIYDSFDCRDRIVEDAWIVK